MRRAPKSARRLRRGLIGFALAALAGFIALELACLWIIAATWDGPNRLTAVGALCVGFVLARGDLQRLCEQRAERRRATSVRNACARSGVRTWQSIGRARSGPERVGRRAQDECAWGWPQQLSEQRIENARERLQRSREEIFALAHGLRDDYAGAGAVHDDDDFPRSRLMRALTGQPGRVCSHGGGARRDGARPSLLWRAAKVTGLLRPLLVRYVLPRLLR